MINSFKCNEPKSINDYLRKLVRKVNNYLVQFAFLNINREKKGIKNRTGYLNNEYGGHTNECEMVIAPVYKNKTGIVTIISDDADIVTARHLNSLAKKYGIPITVAGPVKYVHQNLTEWKSILNQGMLELVNHSYNHCRMDENWEYANNTCMLKHEIIHAQKYFHKYFGLDNSIYIYPENIICEMGYGYIRESGVIAVRGYGEKLNTLSISDGDNDGDWHNLSSYGIMDVPPDGISREEMRTGWLRSAKDHWLIEQWHNIGTPGFQSISREEAEEHFKNIVKHRDLLGLWCANFSDAVKYLREKEKSRILSWIDGSKLRFIVLFENEEMFSNLHPLTLIFKTYKIELDIPNLNNENLINDGIREYIFEVFPNIIYEYNIV